MCFHVHVCYFVLSAVSHVFVMLSRRQLKHVADATDRLLIAAIVCAFRYEKTGCEH